MVNENPTPPILEQEKQTVKQVYNVIADEYDLRFSAETPNDKRFNEMEMTFILGKLKAGDEVLDMGCGTGRFTVPMAEKVRKVTGLDLCPAMIEKAREKTMQRGLDVEFREGDMTSLPFADNSFDVVTSMVALMHIPLEQRQNAFSEAARVLKPGGKMIINVKNTAFEKLCPVDRFVGVDVTDVENKQLVFTQNRTGNDLTTNWYSFSPEDLNRLFSTAGLSLVHMRANIPIFAWLANEVLQPENIYAAFAGIENLLADVPPFNHLGYYTLAEAVKPA
jgi:ubiquinone/menaquinone biosynthesis C-methylase UbiE